MSSALLGILQLDRGNPHGYGQLAGLVQSWLQDAGGFAAVGLVVYLIYALATPTDKSESERLRVPVSNRMVFLAGLALICYALVLALLVMGKPEMTLGGKKITLLQPAVPLPPLGSPVKVVPPAWHGEALPLLLMFGGVFALVGLGEPFARDLLKMRWRRIWALSRLGFKEAIRFRLHWLLLVVMFLPFMFRNVWMSGTRPVDEFRSLVGVTTMAITILVLVSAVLLSAFSLPTDIKNQTIHTVVTKPVERFEIALGRFFGYTFLMTLGLIGMTLISLVLISGATIDKKAQEETVKARVPTRGALEFKASAKRENFDGTNVGREFDYRKYISGHETSNERAVWNFTRLPASLSRAANDRVPVEFTFDIFRMTKGEENKGVSVAFRFVTHNCPQKPPNPGQSPGIWQWVNIDAEKSPTAKPHYDAELKRYRDADKVNPEAAEPNGKDWAAANALAEKFGFYEVRGKDVYDYAVMSVDVPAGLFRNAAQGDPGKDDKGNPLPRFKVYVKCESGGQLLGMAEPDLYLLEANKSFSQNFVKGMVGLWCRLCIVVGVAVACSTYLSGVLSLLLTATIYLLGFFTDHMADLAANRIVGGGPFESMSRLVKAEGPMAQVGDTAGFRVIQWLDQFWAWTVRRIQNVVPDVDSFAWTHFVSEGFNVNTEYLVVNLLVTVGYLLPWGILAYYLLKSREVAN